MKNLILFIAAVIISCSVKAQTANTFSVKNTTGCPVYFAVEAFPQFSLCSGSTVYTTQTYYLAPGATITLVYNTAYWASGSPSGPVEWSGVKIFSLCGGGGSAGSCYKDLGYFEGCTLTNVCMLRTCAPCGGTTMSINVTSYNVVGGELYVTLY